MFLTKILFQEFLYWVLLVLSRCCFHHLVENSILYKTDVQHFCIGPILFSENKIIRSVVGWKVDGQILFGARSEKPKILFGARAEKWKNLFSAKWQSVKGLRSTLIKSVLCVMFIHQCLSRQTCCLFSIGLLRLSANWHFITKLYSSGL